MSAISASENGVPNDGRAELLHIAFERRGFTYMPHENTVGDGFDLAERERLRAAAGELVDASEAAMYLDVKPATLRVWAHRGKLAPACYRTPADPEDIEFHRGQRVAMYRLSDVFAYAEAHGLEIDYY